MKAIIQEAFFVSKYAVHWFTVIDSGSSYFTMNYELTNELTFMRILGIDPGIGRMGWGVIEAQSSKFKVIGFGCVETEPKTEIPGRLFAIHEEVCQIIKEFKPKEMAIEELFFGKNVKTAFVVGQARGVILLAGSQNNLLIGIYTPLQVKIALTGYGRAEKSQVGKMVKTVLGLKEIPKPDDTADALAIALTHAFSSKFTTPSRSPSGHLEGGRLNKVKP